MIIKEKLAHYEGDKLKYNKFTSLLMQTLIRLLGSKRMNKITEEVREKLEREMFEDGDLTGGMF